MKIILLIFLFLSFGLLPAQSTKKLKRLRSVSKLTNLADSGFNLGTNAAFSFDGSTMLKMTTAIDYGKAESWTLEFWFYPIDTPDNLQYVHNDSTVANNRGRWGGGGNARYAYDAQDYDDGTSATKEWASTPSDSGTWIHMAMVNDVVNDSTKLYKNGVLLDGSPTDSMSFGATTFGGYLTASPFYYTGYIDDMRLWNVPRTESQINTYKDQQLSKFQTGLVSYWPLNSSLNDLQGSNHLQLKTGSENFILR